MRFLIAVLIVLTALYGVSVLAGDAADDQAAPPTNSRFVDLDGDGLNDNILDQNHDGIPDFGKKEASQRHFTVRGVTTDIFKGLETNEAPTKLYLSNSDRFRSLKFCTRSLAQCRGGFTSGDEFGPGNGIGQGALSGNCAGGVCHR
jgi:hypothetical protein